MMVVVVKIVVEASSAVVAVGRSALQTDQKLINPRPHQSVYKYLLINDTYKKDGPTYYILHTTHQQSSTNYALYNIYHIYYRSSVLSMKYYRDGTVVASG